MTASSLRRQSTKGHALANFAFVFGMNVIWIPCINRV